MATVVRDTQTGARFVLLGSGFGAFQSKKPNWILGDLMADTTEGKFALVCVCDESGRVFWVDSSRIQVESVDGQPAHAILSQ